MTRYYYDIKILMTALFLGAVLGRQYVQAQDNTVNLIFAETVEDAEGKKNTTKASGNVQFEHDTVKLYCDSALLFRDLNLVKAYGNVQINQHDTINLFCDSLIYDGNTKISKLKSNVRFRDNEYKMITDSLTYDGNSMVAFYKNWGTITSIKNDLKLISKIGYYHSQPKTFFFRDSVKFTEEKTTLTADTLEFRTPSSTLHFHGPTKIVMDSTVLFCKKGTYFTEEEYTELWNGAELYEKSTRIYADSLTFDKIADIGVGYCNVNIKDTAKKKQEIRSDYLYKFPGQNKLKLADNATIIEFKETDTLIIRADTINWEKDSLTEKQKSIAQFNVNVFNGKLIAVCDSASFLETDSLLKLHKNPIIWNDNNQITGDSAVAVIYDGNFDQITIHDNSMLVGKKDSVNFDQIKGKDMIVRLDSNKIDHIFIERNAQTLYYVEQEAKDSTKKKVITGLNKIECNNIVVYFLSGEIDRVKFNEQPDATFYPIEKLPEKERFLKDFSWEIERRPKPPILE